MDNITCSKTDIESQQWDSKCIWLTNLKLSHMGEDFLINQVLDVCLLDPSKVGAEKHLKLVII